MLKHKGKIKLQKRVNIVKGQEEIALITKKRILITEAQYKIMKSDLIKGLQLEGLNIPIIFKFHPSKPFTSKGILVRMGKGKGKIKYYGTYLPENTICVIIRVKEKPNYLNNFIKKYSFIKVK